MNFYRQSADGKTAQIYITGDITAYPWPELGEASAASVLDQIKGLDVEEIEVHLDSLGGSVKEAWGIYSALKQHKAKVTTYADGFVASAALYPFLAGDERKASPLSAFYLHEVMTGADGYAEDLRKAADEAEKMTDIGISAFEAVGMDREQVRQMMAEETWLDPEEAKSLGIVTEILEEEAGEPRQSLRREIAARMRAEQKQHQQQEKKSLLQLCENIHF